MENHLLVESENFTIEEKNRDAYDGLIVSLESNEDNVNNDFNIVLN